MHWSQYKQILRKMLQIHTILRMKSKKVQETALSFLMGDQDETENCSGEEVDKYLSQKAIPTNSTINKLDYWKRHLECYPLLAKRLLCVPATSVPAERVFSTAGLTKTNQRCSLSTDNADMLIFLQKNLPKIIIFFH